MKSLLLSVIVLLTGCASAGRKISADDVSSIRPGTSTRRELIQRLGEPLSMALSPEGKSVLNWHYIHVGPFGSRMQQQILTVSFQTNDIVDRVLTSGQFTTNTPAQPFPPARSSKGSR